MMIMDLRLFSLSNLDQHSMSYRVEKHWRAFNCECVVAMMGIGHRCGYVGVDKNHPLYGCTYHEHSSFLEKWDEELKSEEIGKRGITPIFCWDGKEITPQIWFNVHGSLTYSGGDDEYPIKMDGVWWFGYDCGHCTDKPSIPDVENISSRQSLNKLDNEGFYNDGVLRSLEYCIEECESLAKQLNELLWLPALDHPAKEELLEVMEKSSRKVDD